MSHKCTLAGSMTGAAWNWVTTWETTLLAPGNHLSRAHGIQNLNLKLDLSCNPHFFHLSYVRRKQSPGAQEKSRPEDSCSQGPQGPGPDLRVPATLPSGWPVSLHLQVAVAVDSNPLHPALPTCLLPLKSCLHQSQLVGHVAADADVTTDPRNIRTLTSQTYSTTTPTHLGTHKQQLLLLSSSVNHSPQPSRAVVWILSLYRSCGCSSACPPTWSGSSHRLPFGTS